MAITTKPAQKSKTKKQNVDPEYPLGTTPIRVTVECTWKKVRSEFPPQWRELLADHTWINDPIVEPVNCLN